MSRHSKPIRRQALRLRTRAIDAPSAAARQDCERLADAYEGLAREIERLGRLAACFAYLGSEPL